MKVDHFLDGFFRPESVAVVGATNNPFKPNFRLLENLVRLRFEGRLYPINPSSSEILGVRAFPRLSDVPERPDLVISAVPAAATLNVARECDALGIRRLIIVSGGEGVLATDALETNGFKPASLGPGAREKLKRVMPPWEIPVNPFDVGVAMQFHFSDLPGFTSSLAAIPEDNDVDCVVMQLFPNLFDFTFSNPAQGAGSDESAKRFMEQLVDAFLKMKDAGKPLAFWQSSLDVAEQKGLDVLEWQGVPVFRSADRAVRAMAALREHGRRMKP